MLSVPGLWGLLIGVTAGTTADESVSRIFRCRAESGEVLYAQFCPPGRRLTEQHAPDSSFVPFTPVSPEEHEALARLEKSLERDRKTQLRAARKRSRQRAEARSLAADRCRNAAAALEDLAAERRRGYTARERGRLDAREREWSRIRRENC
jgi:hypothetical protein